MCCGRCLGLAAPLWKDTSSHIYLVARRNSSSRPHILSPEQVAFRVVVPVVVEVSKFLTASVKVCRVVRLSASLLLLVALVGVFVTISIHLFWGLVVWQRLMVLFRAAP